MDDLTKLRVLGFCLVAALDGSCGVIGWTYWEELDKEIEERKTSKCGLEVLYMWELGGWGVWILALSILLWVISQPAKYRYLLISLYLLGPFTLCLTCITLLSFLSFHSCCLYVQDNCLSFPAYQQPSFIYGRLSVSLVLSSFLTLYFLFIVLYVIWGYIDTKIRRYSLPISV